MICVKEEGKNLSESSVQIIRAGTGWKREQVCDRLFISLLLKGVTLSMWIIHEAVQDQDTGSSSRTQIVHYDAVQDRSTLQIVNIMQCKAR